MTNHNKIFTAIAATGLSLSASAATTSVSTVGDLIDAVSSASAGDEIVVMASGSPYKFAETDGDANGHLSAAAKITLRGSTGNPDDVVLVGNGNRILYLTQKGNSISNLTFRSGNATGRGGAILSNKNDDSTTVIQKCVFESCSSSAGGGACGTSTANNAYCGKYIDCTFSDCTTAGSGGAIYNAYSIQGCKFRNNSARSSSSLGGAVRGAQEITRSTFAGNSLSAQGDSSSCGGGAVYLPANTKYGDVTISSCTFTANSVGNKSCGGAILGGHAGLSVVNCVFSNNFCTTGNGGALANVAMVSSSSIVSNATSTSGYGGGVYECTLIGCYVASNYASRCGAAADSRLYSCTNEANSADDYCELGKKATGCYAENGTFLNVGADDKRIFGTSGFNRCRFIDIAQGYVFAEYVAMTNCLIVGSRADGELSAIFYNLKDSASSMVNCTVVSNSYKFAKSCTVTDMIDIKNCFFYGNKIGEAAIDIDKAWSFVASIKNCILSAASDSYIPDYETSDNLNIYGTTFNPGFVGAADPENPFALSRRSPAVAKVGLVEDWMASATDIRGEGFPRLRDGKVNIGCYQCWKDAPGFSIVFR